jgi:tRNA 5-methylaminomethyl-2-thiouridine biosynthesis bifunctional protein
MNGTPIHPAALEFDASGRPYSRDYPAYRARATPAQADPAREQHIFLAGNDLPTRWQRHPRFVVLETGFAFGHNFVATWQAWRDDPERCERLVFIAIEPHPLTHADLVAVHRDSSAPELADALCSVWPPLTHNLHSLEFDTGRVQLLLAFGDLRAWLPELVAEVDAFFLERFATAPEAPMWEERFCKAIGRLATPGATLTADNAEPNFQARLHSAGFAIGLAPSGATFARYAPPFTPRRAPSRLRVQTGVEQHAVIVGAGLAGCATACALAAQGWRSTLLERGPDVAGAASGNPAGLFHGIVNAQDGVHARFNRAAALSVACAVKVALDDGVPGAFQGLLRLENVLDPSRMRALLARLALPPHYVQALSSEEASERAGIALSRPCWFYPTGGWVAPAGLARSYLRRAGPHAELRFGADIRALERGPAGWRLIGAQGDLVAEARTVVLANAFDALRLLDRPGWPIESVRGQISLAREMPFELPHVPVAGSGYLLPDLAGLAMFGATAQANDADASVRATDHAFNIDQLERLLGRRVNLNPNELGGRTAWRCTASDRLPVIGAVPDLSQREARRDQPRFVPRLPGLFVFTALGSRGIGWSALGAQVLAACVSGAPMPLEASLLDAIDPARFVSRQSRIHAAR